MQLLEGIVRNSGFYDMDEFMFWSVLLDSVIFALSVVFRSAVPGILVIWLFPLQLLTDAVLHGVVKFIRSRKARSMRAKGV